MFKRKKTDCLLPEGITPSRRLWNKLFDKYGWQQIDKIDAEYWSRWENEVAPFEKDAKIPREWLRKKEHECDKEYAIITSDMLNDQIQIGDNRLSELEKKMATLQGTELENAKRDRLLLIHQIEKAIEIEYHVGPPRFVKGMVYEDDLEPVERLMNFK